MADTTKMTQAEARKKVVTVAVITAVVSLAVGIGAGVLISKKQTTPVAVKMGQEAPAGQGQGSSTRDVATQPGITVVQDSSALAIGSGLSAPSVAAITVGDQKAGESVLVSLVSTDAPAWLALRENNNGLVGNILGARRVDVGTTGNVDIPLLRSTQAGKSYFVVLFKDNGDKVFDFKTDPPMTADGTLISKMFAVN